MIVYDYKELSQTEIAELGELVEVHTQVMNKFYQNKCPAIVDINNLMRKILKFKESQDDYTICKQNSYDEKDLNKVREQKF